MLLPAEARPPAFAPLPVFTDPTYHRFLTLTPAAIPATGRRAVANIHRVVGDPAPGLAPGYRRGLPGPRLEVGCAPARFRLAHATPGGAADRAGDGPVDGRSGPEARGKGPRRDPARSPRSRTAWRYGCGWAVLPALAGSPLAARRWALPTPVGGPVTGTHRRLVRGRHPPGRGGDRDRPPAKGLGGPVPIRRVLVGDATGTHRDESPFATGTARVAAVVGAYRGRWPIGTTFQKCRSPVGLGTARGRPAKTVCRAGPCLFGLYSVVAALYHPLPGWRRAVAVSRPGEEAVALSDALAAVRRSIRADGVFRRAGADGATAELPADVRELLIAGLAPAP